jgi:DNA-binding beta-propeller fold protein YncE
MNFRTFREIRFTAQDHGSVRSEFYSSHQVALVEDENGIVYYFDLGEGKVTHKVEFERKGDFEDLKVFGDTAYVLRSDGTLFQLMNLDSHTSGIVKNIIHTGLTKKNNTEGLCYDKRRHALLIACKNDPGENSTGEKEKAIYSFNPDTGVLSDTPVVRIRTHEVEKLAYGFEHTIVQKYMRFYRKVKQNVFQPSGLSINPVTGDLYIISSVGNLLVVVDSTSKVKHAIRLSKKVFKQPEGIDFDPAGNLYVSNEGRNGKGNVLKFPYIKK